MIDLQVITNAAKSNDSSKPVKMQMSNKIKIMKTKHINTTLIIVSVLFFGQLIIRLIFF